MPNQEDYLDRVWIKVINLDPKGSWVEDCRRDSGDPIFEGLDVALDRIATGKISFEHLGRVFRWVRYEACRGAFQALEKPGLKFGKVRGLHRQLEKSRSRSSQSKLPEGRFTRALWQVIAPAQEGTWLAHMNGGLGRDQPFGDVPPSIDYLLKRKVSVEDLKALARWHRYDAILNTLQLMDEEGFERASQIPGLHEIMLGLEPSGKEARAGSWPFLRG